MSNWKIHAALCSNEGIIRKNNEDAFYFNGQYMALDQMDQGATLSVDVPAQETLWAVCDGMGGQSNGEVASYTAVSGMEDLQNHLKGRNFEATIQSWVRQANKAVMEQAEGGGTTLAMLYCGENYLQVAHVGDSRVYRYHAGELTQMTRDHSKVEMLYAAGMITKDEMRTHPQKNIVTRYLGMSDEYVCEATLGRKMPFMHGDRYLLCSDGVTDMLRDEEIADILKKTKNVAESAEELKERVLDAGARDNLTLIVLELESEDGESSIPEEGDGYSYEDEEDNEPTIIEDENGNAIVNVNVKIRQGSIKGCEVSLKNCPKNVRVRVRDVPA